MLSNGENDLILTQSEKLKLKLMKNKKNKKKYFVGQDPRYSLKLSLT